MLTKGTKLRFWCQKVLPLVYDDSLSYYELLNKVVLHLNQNTENINQLIDFYATFSDAIEEVIHQMMEDGEFNEIVANTLGSIIAEEYDPTKTYIIFDYCIFESKLYRANGSTTGEFDPEKWDEKTVGYDLTTIQNYIYSLNAGDVAYDPTASYDSGTVGDKIKKLNAGNVPYDESSTYDTGTVGKELQSLAGELEDLTAEDIAYNAQVVYSNATVGKELKDLKGTINSLRSEKHVIVMGDSYSQTFTGWTGWIDQFKSITPFDVVAESPTGGSGFIGDPNIPNFETQLRNLTVADPDIVSDIIIMGGYNDISTDRTEAQLNTAIKNFATYANSRFKNAKIHFGLIAVDMRNTGNQQKINSYSPIFRRCCAQNGVAYITNSRYILLNMAYIFNETGNANSGFHPTSDGNMLVARYLDEYLCSGTFDVIYGANYRGLNIYTFNGEVRTFPGYNTPAGNDKVFYGAIAGTYAADTWTTMSTFSATNIPCLWGTHSAYTTLSFYLPVFDNNGFKDFVLFRVFDKQLQIYSGSDGLTFSGSGYAKPTPFSAPLEACYG